MADHYRRSSATCTRRRRRGPSSKVRKWSIVGITAAYVLILAVGVRINGVVEAQAQYEAQVAATLEAEAASAQLAQEARDESALVLSARATQLSQNYQQEWEER